MAAETFPLGKITWETLRKHPETSWFALAYGLYSFDDKESYLSILAAAKDFPKMEVRIFAGVWCPDCQLHLPAFARIADAVKFPVDRINIYSLDRDKTFPGGEDLISRHGTSRLPTFVFLKNGQEFGRIIETPEESLIRDWALILKP